MAISFFLSELFSVDYLRGISALRDSCPTEVRT